MLRIAVWEPGCDWTGGQQDAACASPRAAAVRTEFATPVVELPQGGDLSDESLMARYRTGDQDAFRRLYFRHHAKLHRFVVHLLAGHRADAEEVFQDTWLAVIRGRERYVDSGKFATYLFTIAHRRVQDCWRRQYRQREHGVPVGLGDDTDGYVAQGSDPASPDTPEASVHNEGLGRALLAGIAALPEAQRSVFLLRAEADLSLEEIATVTGVSRDTAKSRLRYAIDKLRPALAVWR